VVFRQPAETQTLFAELSERLRALEAARGFASLKGGFSRKRIGDAQYWYFKTSEAAGGQREYAVGPDTTATRAVIDEYRRGRAATDEAAAGIARLCAMLRQGGAVVTDAAIAKVISALASAGVFRLGGVLIGTHAFIAMANLLGVRWQSSLHTQDIDVAVAPVLEVAIGRQEADVPRALDSLNLGFLPLPGLDPRQPETSFKVRGRALRVDLLTPRPPRHGGEPIPIRRLKACAQPLEFIDYLLEAPVPVPIVDGGATLVNVPDPARFALHKLIVGMERPVTARTKSAKDLQQAAQIIEVLMEDRTGDLELAVESMNSRPKRWRATLRRALERLPGSAAGAKNAVRAKLVT